MTETTRPRAAEGSRFLGLLALCATIAARGLATALPGAAAGIERWIETTQIVAAVLSQATFVVGVAVAISLLLATLWHRGLPWIYRSVSLPATAIVVTLLVLSFRIPLHTSESRVIAVSACLLAALASIAGFGAVTTRAAALVLACTAAAGALHLVAHAVAGLGGTVANAATVVASLGFATDVVAVLFATTWLVSQRRHVLSVLAVACALGAAAAAWGAAVGSADGARLWQVVASRALGELATSPAPFVSAVTTDWVNAFAFALSGLLLLAPRATGVIPTAMALTLLVRATPDIPLCALMLVLAALLVALEAARHATRPARSEPSEPPTELSTT